MRLSELLAEAAIEPVLRARDKNAALRELSQIAARAYPGLSAEEAYEALCAREKIGTTGMGEGVAIPHGRLKRLPALIGCLGISREGVDFAALDGRPTHLFFLLLSQEGQVRDHLQAVARVTRVLNEPATRAALLCKESAAEVLALVRWVEAGL